MDWVQTPDHFARLFTVTPGGETVEVVISHEVSAAFDILTDAGYSPEKAAEVAAAAERGGYDPEAMARKMVRLRETLQRRGYNVTRGRRQA